MAGGFSNVGGSPTVKPYKPAKLPNLGGGTQAPAGGTAGQLGSPFGSPYAQGVQAPQPQQPVTGPPSPVPGSGQQAPPQQGSGPSVQPPSVGGPQPNPYNMPQDLAPNYGDGVYADFENARQQALQGNISRANEAGQGYQQLEQDYASREQRLGGLLEGFGDAQNEELTRQFDQQKAGLTQAQISRGVYNTSAASAQERGLTHEQGQQQRQLQDMLTRQKMDYMSALSKDTLGARGQSGYLGLLERINETGPGTQDVEGLAGLIGQAQGGTPDYLGALGSATGQAPPGPQQTGGTLAGPSQTTYGGPGALPQGPTTTGAILPPNPSSSSGPQTGQPGQGPSPKPQVGPGGPTDIGPGVGGGTGGGVGKTTPTDVPGFGGGSGGGSGGGTTGGGTGGTAGTGGGGGTTNTSTTTTGSGGTAGGGAPTKPSTPEQTVQQQLDWLGPEGGTNFYQQNIAKRVKQDPNWEWWNDGVLYAMAPTNLQARMDELNRTDMVDKFNSGSGKPSQMTLGGS